MTEHERGLGQEQTTRQALDRAQEALRERDTISMYINNKISLEELVGPIPERTVRVSQDIGQMKDRVEELERKYKGIPEQVIEVREKGLLERAIEKIMGRKRQEVVSAEPGLISQAQYLYDSFKSDIAAIKETLPELYQNLNDLESYVDDQVSAMGRFSDLYFGLEEKQTQITAIREELSLRLADKSLSAIDRLSITRKLSEVDKHDQKLYLAMNTVSTQINVFKGGIEYFTDEILRSNTYMNMIEIGLASVEPQIDAFLQSKKTKDAQISMMRVYSNLASIAESMKNHMREWNQYDEQTSELVNGSFRIEPFGEMFTPEEHKARHENTRKTLDTYIDTTASIRNRAKANALRGT